MKERKLVGLLTLMILLISSLVAMPTQLTYEKTMNKAIIDNKAKREQITTNTNYKIFSTTTPPIVTYGYDAYLENITIVQTLIVENYSEVKIKNLELETNPYNFPWYIYVRDYASLEITNLIANNSSAILIIILEDNAKLLIDNSNIQISSLYIYTYGNSKIFIKNSLLDVLNIIMIQTYNNSVIYIKNATLGSTLTSFVIEMYGSATLHLLDSQMSGDAIITYIYEHANAYFTNTGINVATISIQTYDRSTMNLTNIASTPSNRLNAFIDDNSALYIYNSSIYLASMGLALDYMALTVDYMGSLYIYNSSIHADPSSMFSRIAIYSIGYTVIHQSYISNFSVYFPTNAYIDGYRIGSDPIIHINDSNINEMEILGTQRVLFSNASITKLNATRWYYGDLTILNNVYNPSSGTLGPHPFILQSSSITTFTFKRGEYGDYLVQMNGDLEVYGSNFTDLRIIDSNGTIYNSSIYELYSFNSFIDFNDSKFNQYHPNRWFARIFGGEFVLHNTTNLLVNIYVLLESSTIWVYNSTVLELILDNNNGGDLYLRDLMFLSSGFMVLNALNSPSGVDIAYLEIDNIMPMDASSTLDVSWYIQGGGTISDTNVTGGGITVENASITVINSTLGISGWSSLSMDISFSDVTLNLTSLFGFVNVWEGGLLRVYNESLVSEVYYFLEVWGEARIVEGLVVSGFDYRSGLVVDSTSIVGFAVPDIFVSSRVVINDSTVQNILYGDGAEIVMNNVFVQGHIGIIPFYIVNLMESCWLGFEDIFNLDVSVDINDTSIIGVLFLIGNGAATINNSYVYFLTSVLTNTIVTNTHIDYALDVFYIDTGTASLIDDTPSGFSGSYTSYGSGVTILNTYRGVFAFGDSEVTIRNSTVGLLFSANASRIYAENFSAPYISMMLWGFFLVYIQNNGNITFSDLYVLNPEHYQGFSFIAIRDTGILNIYNSTVPLEYCLFDDSMLNIINSTIYLSTDIEHGYISMFDGSDLSMYNSTLYHLYVDSTSTTTIDVRSSSIYSARVYTYSPLVFNLIESEIFMDLTLTSFSSTADFLVINNSNINSLFVSNFEVEILGTERYSNISNIYTYISNIAIEKANISFLLAVSSWITTNESIISTLNLFSTDLLGRNSSLGSVSLTLGSSLSAINSNITEYVLATETITSTYLFEGIPSVFYYNTYIDFNGTSINYIADELWVVGTGYFEFEGGAYNTYLSVTVTNLTNTFTNTEIRSKSDIWYINLYLNDLVNSRVTNFKSENGFAFSVIKVSKILAPQPLISALVNGTVVASGTTVSGELGLEWVVNYSISSENILDSYNLYVNGSIEDEGLIYNTTHQYIFNASTYITTIGYYNITLEVVDVDGNKAAFTLFFNVYPPEPPEITRTPNTNISFELGMEVDDVAWTITEESPSHFVLYKNGSLIASGSYSSGDTISFDIDGNITNPGLYNITLVAYDLSRNKAIDTIFIRAYPSEAPRIVNTPSNTSINVNETLVLNWTAQDRYPDKYFIYINGTKVVDGEPWSSGEKVSYSFSEDLAGVYNITIVFTDKAGNESKHTVWISVVLPPTEQPGEEQPQPGLNIGQIALAIGVITIILVGIVVILRIRRK